MPKNNIYQKGEGYFKNVGARDIGGKAEVVGYDDCCPPIFIGELLMSGGKRQLKKKINILEKYIKNGGGYLPINIIRDANILKNYFSKK